MRSHEGDKRDLTRADRAGDPPGGRESRLAEAEKQLALALEDVDLDHEPDLGQALTDAVVAVGRAFEHAGGPPAAGPPSGRHVPIVSRDGGRGSGDERRTREPRRGDDRRRIVQAADPLADEEVEAGGLQFAGEPGVE